MTNEGVAAFVYSTKKDITSIDFSKLTKRHSSYSDYKINVATLTSPSDPKCGFEALIYHAF